MEIKFSDNSGSPQDSFVIFPKQYIENAVEQGENLGLCEHKSLSIVIELLEGLMELNDARCEELKEAAPSFFCEFSQRQQEQSLYNTVIDLLSLIEKYRWEKKMYQCQFCRDK